MVFPFLHCAKRVTVGYFCGRPFDFPLYSRHFFNPVFYDMRIFVTYFPPTAAILCIAIGWLMPADTVWSYGIQAVLLSAWPWWMLIWGLSWIVRSYWDGKSYLWGGCFCFLTGIPPQVFTEPSSNPTLVVANVNAFTGHEEVLIDAVQQWEADWVVLIEKRVEDIPTMLRAADDFSVDVPRPSHHMAVYCKPTIPCAAYVSPQVGSATMAMSYGLLKIGDICVVAVHAPPPIPRDTTGMVPYLDELEQHIDNGLVSKDWEVCKSGDAVLLLGDLNAVPRSKPYQKIQGFGLKDQQSYSGVWRLSWPAGGGWINFPLFRLDHIFAHPELQIDHMQMRVTHSDHKALKVWLPNG